MASACSVGRVVTVRLPPPDQMERFMEGERPGDYDRLTAQTARDLLTANATLAVVCGW